jgi:hypothetical protein
MTVDASTGRCGPVGYAHADYPASLSEFGDPLPLPRCGGWLLSRRIPDSEWRDAMGPYPLFCCRDWGQIGADLEDLGSEIVSVVLVTDPFAGTDAGQLHETFEHVVRFKDHYVVDLDQDPHSFVSSSHRARARRALRSVDVQVSDRPWDLLGDWQRLFETLCLRHAITGIRAFSPGAFERQLRIDGLVMFVASTRQEVIGLDLWYVDHEVAYGHLAAFSDLGYELGASYATKWTILEYFKGRVRWIDLMGTPGRSNATDDGLAAFKSGWSTGTRPTYLCGRVLMPEAYDELTSRRGLASSDYFPAYRDGELA